MSPAGGPAARTLRGQTFTQTVTVNCSCGAVYEVSATMTSHARCPACRLSTRTALKRADHDDHIGKGVG